MNWLMETAMFPRLGKKPSVSAVLNVSLRSAEQDSNFNYLLSLANAHSDKIQTRTAPSGLTKLTTRFVRYLAVKRQNLPKLDNALHSASLKLTKPRHPFPMER